MKTGSSNYNITLDAEGREVYPCRCGEIHSGDYGVYDYGYHNCFHDSALMVLARHLSDQTQVVMCPLCGVTWKVAPPDEMVDDPSFVSVAYGLEDELEEEMND